MRKGEEGFGGQAESWPGKAGSEDGRREEGERKLRPGKMK